ncbi:hypothetical protein BO99DRAFT_428347 [Aspergillus violaceofuscus CBS 115571]|uniref:Uncharacterized protein n=1 Tax=Aspergillus violaceofuscus (strain CBS 115571) TaxID=1450538 RepID=A0A2V5I6F5_ASPV1|nr:hypothetical protein BO99DRAFT_428347 [Aspergillus violaceofuscus CBS 115571]
MGSARPSGRSAYAETASTSTRSARRSAPRCCASTGPSHPPKSIGQVEVGTKTPRDRSKSVKSIAQAAAHDPGEREHDQGTVQQHRLPPQPHNPDEVIGVRMTGVSATSPWERVVVVVEPAPGMLIGPDARMSGCPHLRRARPARLIFHTPRCMTCPNPAPRQNIPPSLGSTILPAVLFCGSGRLLRYQQYPTTRKVSRQPSKAKLQQHSCNYIYFHALACQLVIDFADTPAPSFLYRVVPHDFSLAHGDLDLILPNTERV